MSAVTIGEMVGRGAFGEVYKGMLLGRQVAVKQIMTSHVPSHMMQEIQSEFQKEVEVMQKLNHPNIVAYIGSSVLGSGVAGMCLMLLDCMRCSIRDGFILWALPLTSVLDKRMCIVTEWMHKGSLWDIIHNPQVQLSWPQVAKICRDVAAGLLPPTSSCVVTRRPLTPLYRFACHALHAAAIAAP